MTRTTTTPPDAQERGCWQVALLGAPFAVYTYAEPPHLPPQTWVAGLRVLVPVGASARLGVLVARQDAPPPDMPADVRLRALVWPVEARPLLGPDYMALAATLATRQMEPVGRVLENLLPHGLRALRVSFRVFDPRFPARLGASTLAGMADREPETLAELAVLWAEGRMRVCAERRHEKEQEYCFVAQDPPWPVRPAARRQMELLEYLWDAGPVPRPRLREALGPASAQALTRLVAAGLVRIGPAPEFHEADACAPGHGETPGGEAPELTDEQRDALDELTQALARPEGQARLVHGVTGSGKTLLYLRLAERAVEAGRAVLLLAPEVALACALHRAAVAHFPGREVRLYHGYQNPARRERTFTETAAQRGPQVVVGTRSALFLPLRDLGLIVLDEEHDSSFKQEERLPYQAKEVAHFLAARSGGLLVLGSATPDVKTFHAAAQGAVGKVVLPSRVGGRALPPVELVDLRAEPPAEGPFAAVTARALRDTVSCGDQAVILLNRRGYAPVMYCLDCGQTARCAQCDVGLTYHKARERLVCHYCGATEPFPRVCACGSSNWLPLGEGTENLAETLERLVPGAGVLRLDRDSTRRPGRMEEILADFAAGRAQVLVGTQMLSKGHHFPGVTLVAVVEGDMGLNVPDYRAAERMFQLMVQVAGRAGRGDKPGRVLIQTRSPEHYCWRHVRASDYEGFFAQELALRRKYGYPPFTKLALLRMNFPADYEPGAAAVMELARTLPPLGQRQGVLVLGPAPSPLGLLRGRRRFQCLLKAQDWPAVRALYAEARRRLAAHPKIRTALDLDPVSML
ncbi:primosomal protein N' [Desulfocurvus sp.]|uniref:replication restart helicase PriA n=1 Tax=Desulfocurvus sp. TaxID=2871698 RepID=UPI0025B994EA|nr:primosomal protein N' [Desulfocurvus sp.]MCK9239874.1 primosomal protein N' [Desulfocurvus sp.]